VDCFYPLTWATFVAAQEDTQITLAGWFPSNQSEAQTNLNIIAGDFVDSRGIVDMAINLNLARETGNLHATPTSALQLAITCDNPFAGEGVQAAAYPTSDPNGPDLQIYDTSGDKLQATFTRTANYDVTVRCDYHELTEFLTIPAGAFPPALSIRHSETFKYLYCDGPAPLKTLSLAAQTSNAPAPLSVTGTAGTIFFEVQPNHFAGDYQLTATCVDSHTPPFKATPLTLSSSQLPTNEVIVEMGTCVAEEDNAYKCQLAVGVDPPLAANAVLTVVIDAGVFDADIGIPHVFGVQGCQEPPDPQPYANGIYQVVIGPSGCQAGAGMAFVEDVIGAAGTTITHRVMVQGVGTTTATVVLP
jgi:hypothetical protein